MADTSKPVGFPGSPISLAEHIHTVEGGGGASPENIVEINSNYTLANNDFGIINAENLTITLPASPQAGWKVGIQNRNFTNITIARNGSNIMDLAENMLINLPHIAVTLMYINDTLGWKIMYYYGTSVEGGGGGAGGIGSVIISATKPNNYLLCDGNSYNSAQYQQLSEILNHGLPDFSSTEKMNNVNNISFFSNNGSTIVGVPNTSTHNTFNTNVKTGDVVVSTDNGSTWQKIQTPLLTAPSAGNYTFKYGGLCYGNGKFVLTSSSAYNAQNSTNINLAIILYSTDAGSTWNQIDLSTLGNNFGDIVYWSGKYITISGTNNKIFYSTDAITWQSSTIPELSSYIFIANNNLYIFSPTSSNIYTSNNLIDWTEVDTTSIPQYNTISSDYFSIKYTTQLGYYITGNIGAYNSEFSEIYTTKDFITYSSDRITPPLIILNQWEGFDYILATNNGNLIITKDGFYFLKTNINYFVSGLIKLSNNTIIASYNNTINLLTEIPRTTFNVPKYQLTESTKYYIKTI